MATRGEAGGNRGFVVKEHLNIDKLRWRIDGGGYKETFRTFGRLGPAHGTECFNSHMM